MFELDEIGRAMHKQRDEFEKRANESHIKACHDRGRICEECDQVCEIGSKLKGERNGFK